MNAESRGIWIGIDVSKRSFCASACRDGGKEGLPALRKLPVVKFEATPAGVDKLAQWIGESKAPCLGLCAESTGVYSERLADMIAAHGGLPPLAIVNPLRIIGFGKSLEVRQKSDSSDAQLTAAFACSQKIKARPPAGEAYEQIRAMTRLRKQLVTMSTRLACQIEASTDSYCLEVLEKTRKDVLKRLEKVEKDIKGLLAKDKKLSADYELLLSVPSIGKVTAASILGEFGDLRLWSRKQLVAHAGLYPPEHTSGDTVRKKKKMVGAAVLIRGQMFMPCSKLLHSGQKFVEFAANMKKSGKHEGIECVCACMRKLLLVARAVVKSGKPFDPAKAA